MDLLLKAEAVLRRVVAGLKEAVLRGAEGPAARRCADRLGRAAAAARDAHDVHGVPRRGGRHTSFLFLIPPLLLALFN